jgi:hypothetical protein
VGRRERRRRRAGRQVSPVPENTKTVRKVEATPLTLVLGALAVLGVGGAGGSVMTKGQVEAAIAASEARIMGRLDSIGKDVDSGARESLRLAGELSIERTKREALTERVHELELQVVQIKPR